MGTVVVEYGKIYAPGFTARVRSSMTCLVPV